MKSKQARLQTSSDLCTLSAEGPTVQEIFHFLLSKPQKEHNGNRSEI